MQGTKHKRQGTHRWGGISVVVQGLPWWQALFVIALWVMGPVAGTQFGGKFGGGFIGAILAGAIGGAIGGGAAMLCSKLARRPGNAGLKLVSLFCITALAYGGFVGLADVTGSVLPTVPVSALRPSQPNFGPQPAIPLSTPGSCPHASGPLSDDDSNDVFGFNSAPGSEIDGGHGVQWGGPALTVSRASSGVQATAEGWTVELDPARGDSLGCGTYAGATERRNGTGPYLNLSGWNGDCPNARGSFTIHELGFTPQGAVGLLNADFSERCAPNSPPLVGYVRFGPTKPTRFPALPSTAEPVTAPAHVATTTANADEFSVNSAPGDSIGRGQKADFTGNSVYARGFLSSVQAGAAGWSVQLAAKTGEDLVPGTYIGAVRLSTATAPELQAASPSGQCDQGPVYGTFTIYQISFGSNGLTSLNATFSQSCGRPDMPPLVGYIRFHATTPTPVPTLPALYDATVPPATSGTASNSPNLFYVDSAPDNSIGFAQKIYLDVPTTSVDGSLSALQVNLGQWFLVLTASDGKQLAPGTYITKSPDQTPGVGGFSLRGEGGACADAYGTVTIYQIAAKNGTLSQLNASFSQACGSSNAPPLVGFIRFNATPDHVNGLQPSCRSPNVAPRTGSPRATCHSETLVGWRSSSISGWQR